MGDTADRGLRILSVADRVAQPWKNGGGLTREIAVHPPGAGMDSFEWRISNAVVASDGPFSRFPGIDRVLLLLEGEAMDLAIDGAAPVRLTRASPPLPFAADAPAEAWVPKGPISDLNIMVRRGAWTAQAARGGGSVHVAAKAGVVMVVALDRITVRAGDEAAALEPFDAVLLEPGEAAGIEGSGGWVLIRLSRA